MTSSDYPHEWTAYLDLVEQRHGKEARRIAEAQGSALAGDAAELLRRQRMRARARVMRRRSRR